MRYQIVCVNKNSTDDIIAVGLADGRVFNSEAIIGDINGGFNEFYTITPTGAEAVVYAKPPNPKVPHWFLTTHRDGLLPNNLDNLRRC